MTTAEKIQYRNELIALGEQAYKEREELNKKIEELSKQVLELTEEINNETNPNLP